MGHLYDHCHLKKKPLLLALWSYPLFILHISSYKAVSFADSCPSNQPLEVGVSHSQSSAFLVSLTLYFQEIQVIFVALMTIYRPTTPTFISQPRASLSCSRPSHPVPTSHTSTCGSHGHLKHNTFKHLILHIYSYPCMCHLGKWYPYPPSCSHQRLQPLPLFFF